MIKVAQHRRLSDFKKDMRPVAKIGSIPTNRVNLQLVLAVTDTEKDAAGPPCGRQRAGLAASQRRNAE